MNLDPATITAIGGVVVGILGGIAAIVGKRLPPREKQIDDAAAIRKEQRQDITDQKVEIKNLNADKAALIKALDDKDKVFDQERADYDKQLQNKRDEYTMLKISFNQMQEDNARLDRENKRLTNDRNPT